MAIYTISDLHLSFSADKPMHIFGGAWQDHEKYIQENWTAVVQPEDYVILPGDHSWALQTQNVLLDMQYLHALPGTKILLKGNHDLWWATANKMEEFKKAHHFTSIMFLYNDSIAVRSGGKIYAVAGTRGWLCPGDAEYKQQTDEKIYTREAGRLRISLEKAKTIIEAAPEDERGEILAFMHYPPYSQSKDTLFTQCMDEYQIRKCYYGHIHSFTDKDRGEALRTNKTLREHGTAYTLVSCDYTNNQLIRIV